MRLLLDEHFPPDIAVLLRKAGYDAVGAGERNDLSGLADDELLNAAISESRAVVTENVKDFMPLASRRIAEGAVHFGLVVTSASALPSTRDNIGIFVELLSGLLKEKSALDALANQVYWLS